MKDLKELRNHLERQKGRKAQIQSSIDRDSLKIKHDEREYRQNEKAREIVREIGLKMQEQLQYHISDITSLALEAVFENPYKLEVEFIQRRNKTECDLYFSRDGMRVDPLTASGGGTVDVASFALRIASWSMMNPRPNNVIILDEPLRYLSEDNQEKGSQMIKELSKKLGLQFIIVTHEQTLATYADRIFETTIKKGITKIKTS